MSAPRVGLDQNLLYNRLPHFSHFRGVFDQPYQHSEISKRECFYKPPTSEQGLWRGNLILFAVFNFFGEILHQKWNEKMEAKLIW